MTKKIVLITLSIILLFSLISASGNTPSQQELAGNYLKDLGVYKGYPDGTLGLQNPITRVEFAALLVRMIGEEAASQKQAATIFKDVKASHWGSGYINTAVKHKLVLGYQDQTFKPEGRITYAEALAMMIRMLGYEGSVKGAWPDGYLTVASNLGITKGLNYKHDYVVTRGDIAIIIKEALNVEMK